MALQLGDIAPDFEAQTTEGRIRFHEWIGDSWAVLFSHPKDFTPVCTTELGYMAKLKPEFDKRRTKIVGLSVDPVENHKKWSVDIKETQGYAPNYPMIGDTDLKVSKLYGMLPATLEGTCDGRTAADNQTVRNVFVIGPDKKIKLIIVYPMTTGRNFDEGQRNRDHVQPRRHLSLHIPADRGRQFRRRTLFQDDLANENRVRNRRQQQHDAVDGRWQRCDVVLSHPPRDERRERQPEQQVQVGPQNPAIDPAHRLEHVVMVVPVDTEKDEEIGRASCRERG